MDQERFMEWASASTKPLSFNDIQQEQRIQRNKIINSKKLTFDKGIHIEQYIAPFKPALGSIKMRSIKELFYPFTGYDSSVDLLWQTSWFFAGIHGQRPNWSGYMQSVSIGTYPGAATISFLPIIDLDPNNYSCIYSTLLFIQNQSHALNIPTPCITFDQPLWLKSMEIISAKSLNIVTRLDGFHLLMSFLGSVGKMMELSGIEDVLESVYGSNTVKHILSGKAISRALRGHFLVQSALTIYLLQPLISFETSNLTLNQLENEITLPDALTDIIEPLDAAEQDEVSQISTKFMESKSVSEINESTSLKKPNESLFIYKDYLCKNSRTAKLWIDYVSYIDIAKEFIRAERRGDWYGHLNAVGKMLNLFAATGQFNHAKSARLYLQTMYKLPQNFTWLHKQFTEYGYRTIRRADKFWAGLWSDLIIERTLMRTIKNRGGLTRGRGFTEAVRLLWVHTMHKCSAVHDAMSEIIDSKHETSEQHIELGKSRVSRDNIDLNKIITMQSILPNRSKLTLSTYRHEFHKRP